MRFLSVAAGVVLAAAPAVAHEMKFLGPRGGQLAHVGANHFELVPQPAGGARLYVYDATPEKRPVDAARARATARFVVDGRMAQASFVPAGGNTLMASGVRLGGDWTAIVQAGLAPGKPGVTVRFSARAMAAQSEASSVKVSAHAGH